MIKLLQKPNIWAPLLAYLLLTTVLLLAANGIAWLSHLAENGRAIINLRLFLLTGFAVSTSIFALKPLSNTRKKSSTYGIAGAACILLGFLASFLSVPEMLSSARLLHLGSFVIGVGFGCVLKSAIYLIDKLDPRQFMFLFCVLGIMAMLLHSVVDGCPQPLGIALIFSMPCMAIILLSGVLPKYNTSEEPLSEDNSPQRNFEAKADGPSINRQISCVSITLFVLLGCFLIQQSYYLSSMPPESIYNSIRVSFIFSILALILAAVMVTRPVCLLFHFRSFFVALFVSITASTALLLSGHISETIASINFSITSLSLAGCAALFLILIHRCSKKAQKSAVLGSMLSTGLLSGVFLLGTSFPSLRIYFTTYEAALGFSCISFFVIGTLLLTSTGSLSFLKKPALLEHDTLITGEDTAPRNRIEACKLLAQNARLSEREEEVLILLMQGYKSKNIAEKLFVSVNTVNVHIRNIYSKAKIHSRSELMTKLDSILEQ